MPHLLLLRNKVSLDDAFLFFLLLFGPLAHGLVETWSISIAQLLIIALISIAVFTRVYKGDFAYYRTPADIPIALFLLCIVISSCLSVYPYASRIIVSQLLASLALFFYCVNTQRSQEKIHRLLWVIVILGAVYAVMGLTFIDGALFGLKNYSQARYNISLFYVNHNHFAGYLEMVFCLAVGLATAQRGGKRIVLFGMTVLIATALLFSLSRGGILGAACGLAFYILNLAPVHQQKRGRLLFFAALALGLIIIAWFGLHPVLERLRTLDDPALAGEARMQVWRDTLWMISDRPLFGWGPGTFSTAFPAYQTQGFGQKFVNYAHNDYLELAADTGVLGLLTFMSGIVALFFFCLRNLKTRQKTYWQKIGTAALAACFSLLVHSLTDCNLQVPANVFLFVIAAGIAVVAADNKKKHDPDKRAACTSLSPHQQRGLFIVLLLVSCMSSTLVLLPLLGERYAHMASVALRQKQYDEASSAIDHALLLNPDHADFMSFKGDILFSKALAKQTDDIVDIKDCPACEEILHWYQKASGAAPTNSSYLSKEAALLERFNKVSAAQSIYAEAARLSPMYAQTYYHLGILQLRQGQVNEALPYFNRFLLLNGESALGEVLDALWSAGGDYETQKRVVPETASFRQAFARYLANDGALDLAAQEAAFAFALEPSAPNARVHLKLLFNKKDYAGALKRSEEYLNNFPKDDRIKQLYAAILEQSGQAEKAIRVYQQLSASSSTQQDSTQYVIKIARIYAQQKRYTQAIETLEQAAQEFPRSGILYSYMGTYFRLAQKNENALLAFTKAVTLHPSNPLFRYQLGQEYHLLQLEEEALKQWTACLSIEPNHAACKQSLEALQRTMLSNSAP